MPADDKPASKVTEPSRPRLALSKAEAAEALGVSVDYLEAHVMPELRVVRRGRRRLIAVRELERWLAESAERAGENP
jgi:excisionase family DNA binding protein